MLLQLIAKLQTLLAVLSGDYARLKMLVLAQAEQIADLKNQLADALANYAAKQAIADARADAEQAKAELAILQRSVVEIDEAQAKLATLTAELEAILPAEEQA